MITVNEETKSVTISNSKGNFVRIDGSEFQLTNGAIDIVNLPSVYDVEVFKLIEKNYIPKPIVEPIIQEEPLP